MKIRRMVAVWAGKAAAVLCKITGRRGETLPGKIALSIDPNILRDLSSQVTKGIVAVCGTNGKTTTNNLLADALIAEGQTVVCNRTGSNMFNGVVSAFVVNAKLSGNLKADYACIEIDEASTVKVFPHMTPDYMVITNLFRDQLDRYGEIDTTVQFLKKAISMAGNIKLIINGDDSLITHLAEQTGKEVIFFGVSEKVVEEDKNEVREGVFCPSCGEKMEYDFYHYSQLGMYHCSNCGFKRPEVTYSASRVDLKNGIKFAINGHEIKTNYRGFYNIYNILAVYATGKEAGFEMKNLHKVLEDYNPQNGRMESFVIKDSHILLNLAKNPAGFNQNIAAVMEDESKKDIIISINDNAQDGRDVSWLWDVEFEKLKRQDIQTITVTGLRKLDMLLRLKYEDIDASLSNTMEKAIRDHVNKGTKNIYILVNYTALHDTHLILSKMEKER